MPTVIDRATPAAPAIVKGRDVSPTEAGTDFLAALLTRLQSDSPAPRRAPLRPNAEHKETTEPAERAQPDDRRPSSRSAARIANRSHARGDEASARVNNDVVAQAPAANPVAIPSAATVAQPASSVTPRTIDSQRSTSAVTPDSAPTDAQTAADSVNDNASATATRTPAANSTTTAPTLVNLVNSVNSGNAATSLSPSAPTESADPVAIAIVSLSSATETPMPVDSPAAMAPTPDVDTAEGGVSPVDSLATTAADTSTAIDDAQTAGSKPLTTPPTSGTGTGNAPSSPGSAAPASAVVSTSVSAATEVAAEATVIDAAGATSKTQVTGEPAAGSPAAPISASSLLAAGDGAAGTTRLTSTGPSPATQPATAPAQVPVFVTTPHGLAATVASHLAALKRAGNGTHEMRIMLRPVDLGEVAVTVRVTDGTVDVALSGALAGTRDLLRETLPDLRAALRDAGLDVGNTDVGTGSFGAGHGSQATARDTTETAVAQPVSAPRPTELTVRPTRPGGIDVIA